MNYVKYINKSQFKCIRIDRATLVIFILYLIILLRDLSLISLHPNYITILCIILFALFSINNIIKMLMFLLPFSGGLFFHDIVLFTFIIILLKIVKNRKINIELFFFIIIGFCIGFYNILVDISYPGIKVAFQLSVYISTTSLLIYISDKINVEKALKFFIIGTLLSSINVIFIFLSTYSVDYIINYGIRFGNVKENIATVTSFDSNALGMFSIISLSLIYLLNKANHINNFYSNIVMIIIILLGSLSISRTYFLLLFLLIIVKLLNNITNKKGGFINIIIFISLFLITYILFIKNSSIYQYVIQRYYQRFSDIKLNTSIDRLNIFMDYLNIYFRSIRLFLFGAGINGYKTLNNGISTHNGIQEIFLAWGLTGFIIIVSWIILLIRKVSKNKEKVFGINLYIPFLFFIFFIQTLQWVSIYIYILMFGVSILAIKIKHKPKEVKNV